MKHLIEKIRRQEHLTVAEMEGVMQVIMTGEAEEQHIGDFLVALNNKGPSVEEIVAAARIMRRFVVPVECQQEVVLDTCGTGGDGKDTFNISTIAALVAAGAGVTVAKHGNRGVSSRCGSACVLEGLGVNLDTGPEVMSRCLDEAGIAFLFAQKLHPAMRYVAPARKRLGVKTIFNILGPLTNPARATHQVMGVYSRDLVEPMAEVLGRLGIKKALVVHGSNGMDEITTTGPTHVAELKGGSVAVYDLNPAELSIAPASEEDLKGGGIADNVAIVRDVLSGGRGPRRDIVLLNAAAALFAAEKAPGFADGVQLAAESIDRGRAQAKLDQLIALTRP